MCFIKHLSIDNLSDSLAARAKDNVFMVLLDKHDSLDKMLPRNWEILNAASVNFPFLDCVVMKKTILGEKIMNENLEKYRHRMYTIVFTKSKT